MKKIRIVLADTNDLSVDFMIDRITEDFSDDVLLEVITENNLFDKLFESRQEIDFLIVNKDTMNCEELSQHSIERKFEISQEKTKEFDIASLYSELCAEIKGKLCEISDVRKQTQIVLFYGAEDGVGKTTFALGAAYCLSNFYNKKVLYINAEYVQSFHFFFKEKTLFPRTAMDKKTLLDNAEDFIQNEGFFYLPPFEERISAYEIKFEFYRKFAEKLRRKNEYDYIIIDLDSECSPEKEELICIADSGFFLIGTDEYSMFKAECVLDVMETEHRKKFMIVSNTKKADLTVEKNLTVFGAQYLIGLLTDKERINLSLLSESKYVKEIADIIVRQ